MVINGVELPSVGLIRAKQRDGGGFTLSIYPPGEGPLAEVNGGTMIEMVVGAAELERIRRVAPHLVAGRGQEPK